MNAYRFNVINNTLSTTMAAASLLPVVSATKICYNSFGTVVCRERLPVQARIGIWILGLFILASIIGGVIYWYRRRASRARDAIATVEANQIDGPPPTPYGSAFVQVQGQPSITYPAAVAQSANSRRGNGYPFVGYGSHTAAAPQSAYSVGFSPKTPNTPQRPRTSYSSSHYATTPEDVPYIPPHQASSSRPRLPGLPGANPRPTPKHSPVVEKSILRSPTVARRFERMQEPTPRDKNTRFVLPDPLKKERREWHVRFETLKTAPIKKSFDGLQAPEPPPMQSRSAGMAGALTSRLKPLFTGTTRSKEFM